MVATRQKKNPSRPSLGTGKSRAPPAGSTPASKPAAPPWSRRRGCVVVGHGRAVVAVHDHVLSLAERWLGRLASALRRHAVVAPSRSRRHGCVFVGRGRSVMVQRSRRGRSSGAVVVSYGGGGGRGRRGRRHGTETQPETVLIAAVLVVPSAAAQRPRAGRLLLLPLGQSPRPWLAAEGTLTTAAA